MGRYHVHNARFYRVYRFRQIKEKKRRKECVKTYLEKLGFDVNERALEVIRECGDWYSNNDIEGFTERTNLNGVTEEVPRLNFVKRCCADDANLCEIVSITPETSEALQEVVDDLMETNRFDIRYREQLEKTSAQGTAGAYIYLDNSDILMDASGRTSIQNGEIKINYVDADCTVPLTVENRLVTECAFTSTNITRGKERTTLVIFLKDNGKYKANTVYFDDKGHVEESIILELGEVKPFAILTNAEVNNLGFMDGYGLPKVYNTITFFKALDLAFTLLYGDLDKGEKVVFINELLACIKQDNGRPTLTPQQKKLFILMGEKLPDEKTLVQEYNPEIRTEQITKTIELILSMISLSFGYGTKKYSFENGQIKTATEYIGEKQDEMQELNKQRRQAEAYIKDIIRAALWFSNKFKGTNYDIDEGFIVEFDDSFIEDKQSKLESMRTDALSFPELPFIKLKYIMLKYNLPEEEAKKYMAGALTEDEELED